MMAPAVGCLSSAIHVGELVTVLGSWLQPDPALTTVGIWGGTSKWDSSAFQINNTKDCMF